MLTLDLGEATEVVVVDAANLSQYLGDMAYGHGRGWKLVAVLEEEKLEHYNETQPNPEFKSGQGEYGSNVRLNQLQKVQKIKTHKYLLGKSRDTVLEELQQKVLSSSSLATQLEQSKKLVEKKVTELEEKLASVSRERELAYRINKEHSESLSKNREVIHNMELDISKIRTAVGSDRMKEILGR